MDNTGPRLTSFTYTEGVSFKKSGRAIDVLGAGVVEVIDEEDNVVAYTFAEFDASGGPFSTFPYRIELGYKQITANTTAVIIALH